MVKVPMVEVPMIKIPMVGASGSSQTKPIETTTRKTRPIDSILGPSERGAAPLPLPISDGYEPKRSSPR